MKHGHAGFATARAPGTITRRSALRAGIALASAGLVHGPARAARAMRSADRPLAVASAVWNGPREGPPAVGDRRVVILAEDLRNGGVLGVAQGMREGARELGWHLSVLDAGGSLEGGRRILAQALAQEPHGLALCGSPAGEFDEAARRSNRAIPPTVGWHVAAAPGVIPGSRVATNVTTDPIAVARAAAGMVKPEEGEQAGVVVFTDSRFGIATAKSRAMVETLEGRPRTTVLEVLDVPISDAAHQVPREVRRLLMQYGPRWTHGLAINDIYFDQALPTLIAAGHAARHVQLVSAGDGSAPAFVRIRSHTYQVATVAEPLLMQGWQMLDELNRLFSGRPVSGFVTPVALVTAASPEIRDRLVFDPDVDYRNAYRRIWFPGGVS